MLATYVTYVRILDSLVLMSELIGFADCDYEARTYTYVILFLSERGPILTLSAASARIFVHGRSVQGSS
jgi:hypothetical protein